MNTRIRVLESLKSLKVFFEEYNCPGWAQNAESTIAQVEYGAIELKSVIDSFVGSGMGSLIDLYICEDNGHSIKKNEEPEINKKLETLIERLLFIRGYLP